MNSSDLKVRKRSGGEQAGRAPAGRWGPAAERGPGRGDAGASVQGWLGCCKRNGAVRDQVLQSSGLLVLVLSRG